MPPRAFLVNKVAQIIALIFVQDFPIRWPTFFDDLFATLDSGREEYLNMYLKVLQAIDTEVSRQDLDMLLKKGEIADHWYF